MILPKPARRGPKPPRPIQRSRVPITRRRGKAKRSRVPAALQAYRELERRCDRLWSLIVRHKSPWCLRCHQRPTADGDHLISRRYRATRWNTEIGIPLCKGCHQLVTSDTHEHVRLAVSYLGAERWELLNLAKDRGKCDPQMALLALIAEVKAKALTALAIERGLL